MLRTGDYALLAVIFASMTVGALVPAAGAPFRPLPLYCMMALLFLSFLDIRLEDVAALALGSWRRIAALTALKLVLLPATLWLFFRATMPEYALSVLLLGGVSTGVVSPFFATLLGANAPLVLVMVVATSLLVPLTLPLLVKLLAGQSLALSFTAMARVLGMAVFVPILLAEGLKRAGPGGTTWLRRRRQPISLALFGATNLGVFSRYGDYFRGRPEAVLQALAVAVGLAALLFLGGAVVSRQWSLPDRLAAIIGFAIMNNVLVIVFGAEFFSPLEPTVAALYSLPFFGLLVPLRWLGERRRAADIA